MVTNIRKWGHSAGVVLPQSVLKECGLQIGDTVDLIVENGSLVLKPIRKDFSLDQLIGAVTTSNLHICRSFLDPYKGF